MGVFTLHTSNIKGFARDFVCLHPVWIGPKEPTAELFVFRAKVWFTREVDVRPFSLYPCKIHPVVLVSTGTGSMHCHAKAAVATLLQPCGLRGSQQLNKSAPAFRWEEKNLLLARKRDSILVSIGILSGLSEQGCHF